MDKRLKEFTMSQATTTKMFMSIRETARFTGLGEAAVRSEVKSGKVPYITSGNKVLINVPLYLESLNARSTKSK